MVPPAALLRSLATGVLLCAATGAQAGNRITWGWFNAAPYMIADGAERQHGIFDEVRQLLRDELPHYTHKEVQAPFPRIVEEIRNGKPWCFVGGVRTPERDGYAYFSAPVAIFLPFKVIVHQSRLAQLGAVDGSVSLQALLGTRTLRTSVLKGRTFTPAIDALLARRPPSQYHSEFNEALRMLLANRLDYLIDFPLIASYTARQMGREGELVALAIRESTDYTFNRVMCARTEWGRKVIADVDAVLRTERATARYRQVVEKWSDPDGVIQIRKVYNGRFLGTE